jgi:branched-chain amino acid transport system substrate-binding protein
MTCVLARRSIMKAKKIFFILTILAVAAVIFAVIIPHKEADTIKIGVFLPMTGGVASYGQMEWAGIKTANEIQPAVLGKKVALILVDEKSDKIEAANAVSRLIKKENVIAIIGTATSGNTMAGASIAEEAKVPIISPTATDPRVTQNRKYIFRVCFIDPFQGSIAARYAYENLKARRAALLVDQAQDYCVDLANFFRQEFTKMGGTIVASTFCQSGDQDFTAQLSAIIAAKPDVLYLPNYYTEDALVCKQAAELGLKVPVLSADGAQAPELISIGGKAVEGFTLTGHFAKEGASTELAREYIQAYERRNKTDASGFDALGADAYFVLLDAIKRANTTEGPKVREALASTKNFPGVSGVMSIGDDGNARKGMVMLQVRNGKFTYLTTINP